MIACVGFKIHLALFDRWFLRLGRLARFKRREAEVRYDREIRVAAKRKLWIVWTFIILVAVGIGTAGLIWYQKWNQSKAEELERRNK